MVAQSLYTLNQTGNTDVVTDISSRRVRYTPEPVEEWLTPLERDRSDTLPVEDLRLIVRGIAHDLNNLLAVMHNTAELMALDLPPESPEGSSIAKITLAARRAADLTRQLATYARTEHIEVEQLDLNALAEELTSLLRGTLPSCVTLRCHQHPSLPAIIANATQIRQVILNLIINAIEAIKDRKGTISVMSHVIPTNCIKLAGGKVNPSVGAYVGVEVSDTGCGMDAATLARIFEPTFTTKPHGQGLGLATVQQIVHSYEGVLNVTSTLGRGTSFTILFPCSEANIRETMSVIEPYHSGGRKSVRKMESATLLERAIGRQ